MLIAIDFDGTLTADPGMWRDVIRVMREREHRVVCVTARRQTSENIDTIDDWLDEHDIDLPVYYSSLGSKIKYLEAMGMEADIWIDDDPKRCAEGW
jgi:hypothetical protein